MVLFVLAEKKSEVVKVMCFYRGLKFQFKETNCAILYSHQFKEIDKVHFLPRHEFQNTMFHLGINASVDKDLYFLMTLMLSC